MADTKNKIEADTKLLLKSPNNDTAVRRTKWYVITSGPGSGKTTTVQLLRNKGYTTTIEHARHYIDTQRISGKRNFRYAS